MSLEQLIQKCKKNDTKAQSEIYKLYSSKLFSICLKYSRSYAEAEDNLQESFMTIFDKIVQYKEKGSFEGWIKRITVNTVLQRYREKSVINLVYEDIKDTNEVLIEDEGLPLDFLLKIIQELPDRYRLVFNLYALDGYSHKEIAAMLNITVGTSKSNLSRAKQLLKDQIENYNLKVHSQSL